VAHLSEIHAVRSRTLRSGRNEPYRILALTFAVALSFAQTSWAFCGFYVATSDEPLINTASVVVLAHNGDRTAVTMASDVKGDPKQFAIVIPVPTVIRRDQVRTVSPAIVKHLAEFTKPRVVEYEDPDPCPPPPPTPSLWARLFGPEEPPQMVASAAPAPPSVRIEAQFSVAEYDIVVLSATDSGDLLTYLNHTGYKVPRAAEPTVRSYLRQHMHFFLAKVNPTRLAERKSDFLDPIQVTYASPKFMLPIRLGTVNAAGPQDMVVLALTQTGRVETTNYRTRRMPTGADVPMFVQREFGAFYDAAFEREWQASADAVFLEYAWNIGDMPCDPCSAEPLSREELQALGADWVGPSQSPWTTAGPAFVTRMHVRYDRARFPEDLALQETGDKESFQVRFVTHRPFTGDLSCPAGRQYQAMRAQRGAEAASTAAKLTGWQPERIGAEMRADHELE